LTIEGKGTAIYVATKVHLQQNLYFCLTRKCF
jgi:hypothetical protein